MATQAQVLRDLQDHFALHVNSWNDWYSYIDKQVKVGMQTSLPPLIVASNLLQYSFLCAMREMPDEGDIKILVNRAIHILVMEVAARLGISVAHMLDGEEMPTGDVGESADPATDNASAAMVNALFKRLKGQ